MNKIVTTFAIGLTISLTGQAFAWPDSIKTDERTFSGTITAMDADSVTITVNGKDQNVPTEKISLLSFEDEPLELKNAKRSITSGQFDVIGELNAINPSGYSSNAQTELAFYKVKAESMLALSGQKGSVSAAAASAIKFADNANLAKSWHFYEAQELVGDLAMGIGNPGAAIKYYSRLANAKSNLIKINGFNKVAEAQFTAGEYEAAMVSYENVVKVPASTPASRQKQKYAKVGAAACAAEQGKHEKSIEFLHGLIKEEDASDKDLFGRIYNSLGRCYRKAGKDKEAIHAYLFTDTVFFQNQNNHAEALYYLSKLWDAQNKADRGRDAKSVLERRYPNSSWTLKKD